MSRSTTPSPEAISIAEVERVTGVPRATLRIWERRYGFPAPGRDERGERLYPPDQVEQLRLMQQLLAQGHRPARLLAGGAEAIRRLAASAPQRAAGPRLAQAPLVRLLRAHDAVAVRAELSARLDADGLAHFAATTLPHMNGLVGQAWEAGLLQVHEEHLYSDCVQAVVTASISMLGARVRPEAPRVMLTTIPQESHGLGLLIAQAMFAAQGCPTVSLGVRLPVDQIVAGAVAHRADIVGLSFTASVNPGHILRSLEELRGTLPPRVRIWAGGGSPALKRSVAGVRVVADAREIPHALAEDFALPPIEGS